MRHIVVMGVGGCGKSTLASLLASRLQCDFGEGDDFHPAANIAKMRAGHPLTDEDRWGWLAALNTWMLDHERAGKDTVLACSALKASYRRRLAKGLPPKSIVFVWIDGDFELIASRMAARTNHFMPESLLRSQFETLEPPTASEPVIRIDAALSSQEQLDKAAEGIDDFYDIDHNKRL